MSRWLSQAQQERDRGGAADRIMREVEATVKGTFFKGPRVTAKRKRAKKRQTLITDEKREKDLVRDRDVRCRFPKCGCQHERTDYLKKIPTVSHDFHKGMGGDPKGVVSIASLMVLLCKWRHQDAPVSRHKGTLRSKYLTPDQNDGPLAWLIDLAALYPEMYRRPVWVEVGREHYIEGGSGMLRLEPLTKDQEVWLEDLAEMDR